MMNLFKHFHERIAAAIEEAARNGAWPRGLDTSRIAVEPPREASHGDISTNAALVLTKEAGVKPRDFAEKLRPLLQSLEGVVSANVAGPGFINLKLADGFWHARLADILVAGPAYGDGKLGQGRRVNVEYVSANPTGPMHVGHGRGAVIGDALASLLEKVGFKVTREYYVNDAGAQVDALARSNQHHIKIKEGKDPGLVPDGFYPGEYMKEIADFTLSVTTGTLHVSGEKEDYELARDKAIEWNLNRIKADLALLGIKHEVFTSERAIVGSGAIEKALADLEKQGLIYIGTLDPPKGKLPEDWEARPQTLFRSTSFGDDVDRPIKKADGSWTYFAADIAYHWDKFNRGFAEMIDIWGADHGGYVKRMQAAVKALTKGKGALDVKLCQLVNLFDQGQPVKMSKRAGTFVTLREAVEQVGKDVFRFVMLTRRNDQPLDFDFAKVVEQSKDNPVFYVQYAHARARSVLRLAHQSMPGVDLSPHALAKGHLELLTDEGEIALIRQMANWPRLVEAAAETHEPHRIAFYLQELAASFHGLWHKGMSDASLRFLIEGETELTRARLALVHGMAFIIASGLQVFGVTPAEEMRG